VPDEEVQVCLLVRLMSSFTYFEKGMNKRG